jgi:putative addiction module component (TIGR02574 family)
MNKIDEAWQVLKKLPPKDQERMAEVILGYYASQTSDLHLTDEQVAEVEARMRDRDAPTLTIEEVRAHFKNRMA